MTFALGLEAMSTSYESSRYGHSKFIQNLMLLACIC